MEINSKLLGISCIILAHVFFTTQDMTIKFINGDYALYQVMLIRSIVAMLFTLLIFVPIDGGFKYLRTQQLGDDSIFVPNLYIIILWNRGIKFKVIRY